MATTTGDKNKQFIVAGLLTEPVFSIQWKSLRKAYNQVAPQEWRSWLTDPQSLTNRLIKLSRGDFKVNVISQKWQRPNLSEAKILNIKPYHKAFVREVYLVGNGNSWVYARSVIPYPTIQRQKCLRLLGSRSLGTLLFGNPTTQRQSFQLGCLTQENKNKYWGRRSVFSLGKNNLLVTEIFLPELIKAELDYIV